MLEIRQLGLQDRKAWAAQRFALWPDGNPDELDFELDAFVADPLQIAFGAFSEGILVGFAEASERPWGEGCTARPVGWLEGIYVEAQARRSGIGKRLVRAVETWARARGLKELGSDAYADNRLSRESHAHWGFAETKEMVFFRKQL